VAHIHCAHIRLKNNSKAYIEGEGGKIIISQTEREREEMHITQVKCTLSHTNILADVNWKLVKERLSVYVYCMTEKAATGIEESVQRYELTS
jgi:hypothetical protein